MSVVRFLMRPGVAFSVAFLFFALVGVQSSRGRGSVVEVEYERFYRDQAQGYGGMPDAPGWMNDHHCCPTLSAPPGWRRRHEQITRSGS